MIGRRPPSAWAVGLSAAIATSVFLGSGTAQERTGDIPSDEPRAMVRLIFRSLQPGEPLLVLIEGDESVESASASLLGRTAELRASPGGGMFGLIGIDLQVKPGPQDLIVKIRRKGRPVEEVRRSLDIQGRSFPFVKLSVKPEYVTPPASALERIRREAELVAMATSGVTPEWLGDGPFIHPHDAPSWSNFGQRRLNNNVLESVHSGLDIRAPAGEPIRASNAGRVVMASDLYLGGRTVILDHGLGVFSSYGHMSKLLVKRGDRVAKGDVLGLCGSTGRSTGPHLHWSVKILDARVDPEALLELPFERVGPASGHFK